MINLLDLLGGHFHDKIVDLVKQGKKFYTVNDNLNCKTTVKNMRVDHRNKQHNWFASIIVFERIDFRHLDNVKPLFPLPIQFKDEKKYSDVVDILANLEDTFENIFKEASDQAHGIPADFICPSG